MNAKFFDLKKEKQDRMINASLKIFALNGYAHASTDDIVREAHISKGLLFHYFESKIGVYSFLCDYAVKYFSLELSSAIDPSEKSYFAIRKQVEAARLQMLKSYPYMQLFINRCKREDVPEALIETEDSRKQYEKALETIYSKSDVEKIKAETDNSMLIDMLDFTLDSLMENHLRDGSFNAENQYKENLDYLRLIELYLK